MKNEEAISARIKEIYAKSGCATVSKWAQKVFIPQTTLNDIISKEKMPSLATLTNICEYEGISMDWVIFGKDNRNEGNIAIASGDNSRAANGDINSHTTYGDNTTVNTGGLDEKGNPIMALQTLIDSNSRLTKELDKSQQQKDKLISIIENLTNK